MFNSDQFNPFESPISFSANSNLSHAVNYVNVLNDLTVTANLCALDDDKSEVTVDKFGNQLISLFSVKNGLLTLMSFQKRRVATVVFTAVQGSSYHGSVHPSCLFSIDNDENSFCPPSSYMSSIHAVTPFQLVKMIRYFDRLSIELDRNRDDLIQLSGLGSLGYSGYSRNYQPPVVKEFYDNCNNWNLNMNLISDDLKRVVECNDHFPIWLAGSLPNFVGYKIFDKFGTLTSTGSTEILSYVRILSTMYSDGAIRPLYFFDSYNNNSVRTSGEIECIATDDVVCLDANSEQLLTGTAIDFDFFGTRYNEVDFIFQVYQADNIEVDDAVESLEIFVPSVSLHDQVDAKFYVIACMAIGLMGEPALLEYFENGFSIIKTESSNSFGFLKYTVADQDTKDLSFDDFEVKFTKLVGNNDSAVIRVGSCVLPVGIMYADVTMPVGLVKGVSSSTRNYRKGSEPHAVGPCCIFFIQQFKKEMAVEINIYSVNDQSLRTSVFFKVENPVFKFSLGELKDNGLYYLFYSIKVNYHTWQMRFIGAIDFGNQFNNNLVMFNSVLFETNFTVREKLPIHGTAYSRRNYQLVRYDPEPFEGESINLIMNNIASF